ncbi:MAG: hypothetical protein GX241_01390 [Ruminococcaceae bacterium]|nr:hypothetical protein [Oscillospiraceae bacterium]
MILNLFSMGVEVSPSVKESQVAIENAFKSILDEEYTFKNFTNEKQFLEELSTAVANNNIVVVGSEPGLYKAFKAFICNAFKLKSKPNKTIIKMALESHPDLDPVFVEEQALIPSGSTPLFSQDGLYSGFAIKAKKQLLIVLPLDDKRIDYIINTGLQPYVRANMDMSLLQADPLKNVIADRVAIRKGSTQELLYDANAIKAAVKKLQSKGLSVAIANTKTVDFLGTISTTAVDLSKVVFVSAYVTEKEDMSAREYVINLANGALINSSNSVGAAITKVFSLVEENGETQFFMYVCIADKENANVAKLVAEPGETPPQLIYKAIEELFRMLDLWADTGYAIPQFTDESVVKANIEAEEADKKMRKIKIAVSSLISASAIISAILSFVVENIYGVL